MSNAVANGLAGAGAGIIAQIITYPLQTVRSTRRLSISSMFSSETAKYPCSP